MIVDGDNAPGENVSKIEELEERDKVIVYYASNNKYFLNEENRNRLKHSAKCSLEFREVNCGSCAVDFAAAMDLAVMVSQGLECNVALVSKDKHFGIISEHARQINSKLYIIQTCSIKEVVTNYKILESQTLKELQVYFIKMFGTEQGMRFYHRIKDIFMKDAQTQDKKAERGTDTLERKISLWQSRGILFVKEICSHISIWRKQAG